MGRYLVRRFWQTLIVLLCVTLCAFLLVRIAPGSPARLMLPEEASEEQIRLKEIELGLDRPLPVQFWSYISGLFRGDFGMSTIYRQPVLPIIVQRLPNSARIAFSTVFFGCLMAILLGVVAAANRGKALDFFSVFFALFGQSMATPWLAVLNIYIFALKLGWFPAIGSGGLRYMVLPVLTLGFAVAAGLTRIARSGMVNTLSEDYITATYAKGIRRSVVYWKYAFKNAMIPVVTSVGINLGSFLAGTVIVETVFGMAGIGQLMAQSVEQRDYAMVQSLLLVSAFFITFINLVVDIINSWIDPRISLQ
jgi:ABC-type dipeptide/oligopeptide/nickel transport system permease component